jgi:dienelactone hydrolase
MDISLRTDLVLPELTGLLRVGRTTAYLVDARRSALPGVAEPRELVVTVFYPASPGAGATPGPYADAALAAAYSRQSLTEASAGALDRILGHAFRDAPADRSERYPVLLFSPGGGEQPLFYTSLLEQVSSHGYVVVAVPEPFDTPVIPLPDGRVLSSTHMVEWCRQDQTCQAALNGDQGAAREVGAMMSDDRAKDMSFTLDRLVQLDRTDPILAGTMDLNRVGAFGHSYGGASSVRMAQLDPRVKAVGILDSDVFAVIPGDSPPLSCPVLWMTSANVDVPPEGLAEIATIDDRVAAYVRGGVSSIALQIGGTTHQSFQSDALFLAPYITLGGAPVTLYATHSNPGRIAAGIVAYTVAFFDSVLRGTGQALLAGPSDAYPEVSFRQVP